MTITVGTDTYLSVADADAYWAARNNLTWEATDAADKEAALREATAWLDGTYRWVGSLEDTTQVLGWPRVGALDHDGRDLDGGVPLNVEHATAELALAIIEGGALIPTADRGGAIKRVKADTVEVEYQDGARATRDFGFVERLLRGLVVSSAESSIATVGIARA